MSTEPPGVNRRHFLGGASLAGAGLLAAAPRAAAVGPPPASWAYATALDAARAIRARQVTSTELVRLMLARIKAHRGRVNAIVTLAGDALARAAAADRAAARGDWWGPFHGVPFTVKDAFATAGVLTACGTKTLARHVPTHDAVVVARLKAAGAVLLGKSNVPEWSSDAQTYNDLFGVTNNPHDRTRTVGGSSGGAAAALASGHTYLEVGSDLSGSIRHPAGLCGVYGHKPSLNLIPARGHIPPPPGQPMPPLDIATVGPLARSAADLLALLRVLGGPDQDEAIAYRWSLPPARGARLKDYRLGYVLEHNEPPARPINPPVTAEVREVLDGVIAALGKAGANLRRGWPAGVKPYEQFDTFMSLRTAFHAGAMADRDEAELRKRAARKDDTDAWWEARTWTAPHKFWLQATEARLRARAAWQDYFRTHDAFLMPVHFLAAYPHDHRPDEQRQLVTPEGKWMYDAQRFWASFAGVAGLPATVAPVGRTRSGLPVGIQIIGPYLEDATPIDLAGRLADIVGGFVPPKGL